MFPRGGGVWDQDPILMRDFRLIMKYEREWKEVQDQIANQKSGGGAGGSLGMEGALNEYLESQGEDPF